MVFRCKRCGAEKESGISACPTPGCISPGEAAWRRAPNAARGLQHILEKDD